MIRTRILGRYVFREVGASFLACFAIFMLTGLIGGFLPLLQKGMETGLQLTLILFQVLINALPDTLVTVLPLSVMVGVLLGLGRMAADNEIAAIKASGVSLLRLLPPVLFLGMIGMGLCLVCTMVLIPRGVAKGRELIRDAVTLRPDAGIEERTFFDKLKDLLIYTERIDPSSGVMTNLFIRESSDPEDIRTILAKRGKVSPDPEQKALVINLQDGTILKENRTGDSTGTLAFESYAFKYPFERAGIGDENPPLEQMSVSEMITHLHRITAVKEDPPPDVVAFNQRAWRFGGILITQRFVYPMAPLVLALLAFPLGVINMGKSRLNNVSVGLVVIFAYYTVSLTCEKIARSGLLPPPVVLPVTPLFFTAAALYFIHCVRLEQTPGIVRVIQGAVRRLRHLRS
ncbi:MAG: LptF/LptG family permease [Thermodesulfobacteriota bacterium]